MEARERVREEIEERIIAAAVEWYVAGLGSPELQAVLESVPRVAWDRFVRELRESWREDWEMREPAKK